MTFTVTLFLSITALRPRCRRCTSLLLAADEGQMSALCLLDLTAAFDTVDHELLLLQLERQSGLRGTVLQWFRSYLSGRSIRVLYGGSMSSIVYILCSVPQESVLGPRLFILYSADLKDIAKDHCVTIHSFADDTQLYLHWSCNDMTTTIARLQQCIVDINNWMSVNRVKLNIDKTELLWAGTRRSLSMGDDSFPYLQLGAAIIAPSQHVRVLGVIFFG